MDRTLQPLVLIALFAVAFTGMGAQTTSDDEPECTQQGRGKLQLTKEDTTLLGLTIGSASLKDVEAKFGQTDILPRNGSASASNTICYVSPMDDTVVTFGAGPMGGFTDITEFSIWSPEAKFPNRSACRRSPLVSRTISTNSGIRLGLTAEELSKIIGAHATDRSGVMHYELWCRQKMTADEIKGFKVTNNWDVSGNPYFYVGSFVDVHLSGSVASRIDIVKTESY